MTALHQLSLHALSQLIARREIRALDLTDALIARADVAPEVFVLPPSSARGWWRSTR